MDGWGCDEGSGASGTCGVLSAAPALAVYVSIEAVPAPSSA